MGRGARPAALRPRRRRADARRHSGRPRRADRHRPGPARRLHALRRPAAGRPLGVEQRPVRSGAARRRGLGARDVRRQGRHHGPPPGDRPVARRERRRRAGHAPVDLRGRGGGRQPRAPRGARAARGLAVCLGLPLGELRAARRRATGGRLRLPGARLGRAQSAAPRPGPARRVLAGPPLLRVDAHTRAREPRRRGRRGRDRGLRRRRTRARRRGRRGCALARSARGDPRSRRGIRLAPGPLPRTSPCDSRTARR